MQMEAGLIAKVFDTDDTGLWPFALKDMFRTKANLRCTCPGGPEQVGR